MKIYKITEASEYLGVSINTLKTLANLEGAKWLIECYVAKPERYEEYQDVVRAIKKARGIQKARDEE